MKSQNPNPADNDSPDPVLPDVVPVALDDEYEAFDLWMNVQLSQLVARWEHLAAPKARRNAAQVDFGRRFSKPRKAK